MKRGLALAAVVAARTAAADVPPASVDVSDLPPLPAATDELPSSATVLAASSVEEDVVVGAAKREQSLGNVASAVTVVSGDRLRRFGYRTVGEAIAGVAGVYIVDNRISYAAGIRGLQLPGDFNTRILVLIDGASVNEAWGAFAGLSFDNFVSIDDVARIEVIRGPVSSLYGSNAFFGIVNIVTRSAAETPRAWGKASINSIAGVTTSAGFATGDVHRQLRGTFQQMNRFGETHNLPVLGANDLSGDGSHQYLISLVGSYGGSFAQVRAVQYRRDSPFAPYLGDPTDDDPYIQYDRQLLIEGGHTRELSKRFTLAARGYANLYRFTDHIDQASGLPFEDIGDARTLGAEVRGRYELVAPDELGLTAGAETSFNFTKSRAIEDGADLATVPLDFNVLGVYTELDGQPTDWFGYTAGVRFDRNSKIDSRVSPRAALFLAKKRKYGAKFLYAEGFRNPSAFEGFFTDQTSFAANPEIRSELIRSVETVLWAKPVPGLSTRISGFYWDARRVVEQVPYPDPVTGMDLLQFQNYNRFVTRGLEVEGSYRTTGGWYGFGGAALAQIGNENVDMPELTFGDVLNAPAVTASLGVSTPQIGGYLHVSSEVQYIGRRATRPDVDTGDASPDAPGWVGVNLALYAPDLAGFDVTAGVRNLRGKRDRIVAPGDYDRYDETTMSTTTIPLVPGEGREFYVKVGYRY